MKSAEEILRSYGFDNFDPNFSIIIDAMKEYASQLKPSRKKIEFTPPTISIFIDYFQENGFSRELAINVFKGYEVAEWYKSNGQKIRNWKQTCHQVWFKEKNKEKSFIPGKMIR